MNMTAEDSTSACIMIDGLTKRYSSFIALDTVSFSVQNGEFLTLLGPSGSGKTTTLRIIAGFHSPDAGRVLLSGEDITRTPAHKRPMGMVFQNYALFPH